MSDPATVLFGPPGPRIRERAAQDLTLAWASVRATSAFVQQLDQSMVRASVWGDAYANAQAILDSASDRIESWHSSPYPAEDEALGSVRVIVHSELRNAHRHLMAFEWHKTQARLFSAGRSVLAMATAMGVEL